jgi:NAD(P)-dependent dehydrogenase (short-subunit alcohol dehydrogenase family)
MGGKIYEATGSWYHASKFAVEGMSDSLRLELAPHGIVVSIIEPSGTATEWGCIAGELLLAVSGQGAYAAQARSQAAALASTEDSFLGTPPRVAARTIVRASTAKRPRTRYPTGRGAGSILAARRLLPDRAFDALLRAVYSRFSA